MATQQQKGTQGGGAGGGAGKQERSSASGSGTGASSTGEMGETMSTSRSSASSSADSRSTMGSTGGTGTAGSMGSIGGEMNTGRSGGSVGNGGTESGQLMRQVRSTASDAYSTVTSRAAEKLEEQKSTLTGGLHTVASSIRQLGDNLAVEKEQDRVARVAADYSSTAAKKIEEAATYFDTHDVNAIYHDVERYARNNAAIFLGGAFAIGFLVARFVKSSTPAAYGNGNTMRGTRRGNGTDPGTSEPDARSFGH